MAVRILIDSASDIPPQEAKLRGMAQLSMKIIFGDQEYTDGIDLTPAQFYALLAASSRLPTTCQIPPDAFSRAFAAAVEAGDDVVAITLSGKLSGTYQSARIAAADYPGHVYVVDSQNAALGERILIDYAERLVRAGQSAEATAAALDGKKHRIRLLALLDTLEYLKKGGRISAATAFAGSMLSIKPVIAIDEGAVVLVGKARGSRQGNNLLRTLVKSGNGIDFSMPLCLAYSGLSNALLQTYIADSTELWQGQIDRLPIAPIGATIATHVGPGAIAIAFFEK